MVSSPQANNEAQIMELPAESLPLLPADNVCHAETEIIIKKTLKTSEHIKDKTFVVLFPTDFFVHLTVINLICKRT